MGILTIITFMVKNYYINSLIVHQLLYLWLKLLYSWWQINSIMVRINFMEIPPYNLTNLPHHSFSLGHRSYVDVCVEVCNREEERSWYAYLVVGEGYFEHLTFCTVGFSTISTTTTQWMTGFTDLKRKFKGSFQKEFDFPRSKPQLFLVFLV